LSNQKVNCIQRQGIHPYTIVYFFELKIRDAAASSSIFRNMRARFVTASPIKQWKTAFKGKFWFIIHANKFCLTYKVKNFIFLGKINLST